jgi:hypothetical protein
MSQLVSLPPVSPGIVYAVRTLLQYAPETEAAARNLCSQLWPKMDADASETVLAYWHVQTDPETTPCSSVVLPARSTKPIALNEAASSSAEV